MANPLRDSLLRVRSTNILWNTFANQCNRIRHRRGATFTFHTHDETREAAIRTAGYVRHMFADYLRILPPDTSFEGRHILEIGPGDQFGIALLFLAHGAASVTCLDKYRAEVDSSFLDILYAELRSALSPEQAERVREAGPHGAPTGPNFRAITDCPLEDAARVLPPSSVDVAVSRSVLEYLKNPSQALDALHTLLAPGATTAHIIDCRDDGLFSAHGFHPLEFLTLSDATYSAMTSHTYRPNRWRCGDFLRAFQQLGHLSQVSTLRIVGHPAPLPHPAPFPPSFQPQDQRLLAGIRPRLAPRFASMNDADLLTAGFQLCTRSPPSPRTD